jgi:hypothetical protein
LWGNYNRKNLQKQSVTKELTAKSRVGAVTPAVAQLHPQSDFSLREPVVRKGYGMAVLIDLALVAPSETDIGTVESARSIVQSSYFICLCEDR